MKKNKKIREISFQESKFEIEFVVCVGDGIFYKLGKIIPTIDGKFSIDSDKFYLVFKTCDTVEDAKIQAQLLFEQWVKNFFEEDEE